MRVLPIALCAIAFGTNPCTAQLLRSEGETVTAFADEFGAGNSSTTDGNATATNGTASSGTLTTLTITASETNETNATTTTNASVTDPTVTIPLTVTETGTQNATQTTTTAKPAPTPTPTHNTTATGNETATPTVATEAPATGMPVTAAPGTAAPPTPAPFSPGRHDPLHFVVLSTRATSSEGGGEGSAPAPAASRKEADLRSVPDGTLTRAPGTSAPTGAADMCDFGQPVAYQEIPDPTRGRCDTAVVDGVEVRFRIAACNVQRGAGGTVAPAAVAADALDAPAYVLEACDVGTEPPARDAAGNCLEVRPDVYLRLRGVCPANTRVFQAVLARHPETSVEVFLTTFRQVLAAAVGVSVEKVTVLRSSPAPDGAGELVWFYLAEVADPQRTQRALEAVFADETSPLHREFNASLDPRLDTASFEATLGRNLTIYTPSEDTTTPTWAIVLVSVLGLVFVLVVALQVYIHMPTPEEREARLERKIEEKRHTTMISNYRVTEV